MYCYHCAKHIDETKVKLVTDVEHEVPAGAKPSYVCPRCGHLITSDATEAQIKSLSQAAHAQVQRGSNSFALGMGSLSIGVILGIVAVIFFVLAKKPSNQFQLVTDCAEFYVSIVMGIISVILLSVGAVSAITGFINRRANLSLLKDINNRTFVQ